MSFRRFMVMIGCACALFPAIALAKAPKSAVCESHGGRLETCAIRTVNGIVIKRRLSKNRCIEGKTFGIYRHDQMWVDAGCRGEFISRRFGNEVFTRPGGASTQGQGYQAQPWVNPDGFRQGGSRDNGPTKARSPQDWAYLVGRLYARNKLKGVDDNRNAQQVHRILSNQGIDPRAVTQGGVLWDDFARGIVSMR
jgi:hypothetical protein